MPTYSAFDPLAVAFSLPHLQLYRRVDGGDGNGDYRLDLVGESAAQLIGANNRGKLLSEVLVPHRLPERLALFGRPLADGLPIAYRSFLANPGREHRLQKRLLLPFAEGDTGPDLLIAMDGGLGPVSYGALGIYWTRYKFTSEGAHTLQSRGKPTPVLAMADAVQRIYQLQP
ncbi:MAG: hypothetical protein ACK5U4_22995, partial [Rhodospirillales bacterium]